MPDRVGVREISKEEEVESNPREADTASVQTIRQPGRMRNPPEYCVKSHQTKNPSSSEPPLEIMSALGVNSGSGTDSVLVQVYSSRHTEKCKLL